MSSPAAPLTDHDLMARIRRADEQSFAELHCRYALPLINAAYQRLHDRELAEEVVQDLYVRLWLKREQIPVLASVKAYLFAALRNGVIDQFRLRARWNGEAATEVAEQGSRNTTEDTMHYGELQRAYERQVRELPPVCQLVYTMYEQGKAVVDIAQHLDISPKTVESHLLAAKRALRRELRNFA